MKVKEKDKLRLVQWYNDRCPPIDFNHRFKDVLALIHEVVELRELIFKEKIKVKKFRKKILKPITS